MKMTKKPISYLLVFLMVFSSFTILPSEFWGWADVSAVELTTEESNPKEATEEATQEPTEETTQEATQEPTEEAMYTEGDFTYSIINDNEVKIVSYNGTSKDVVIPDVTTGSENPALANKKVTVIGENVFKRKWLTSVVFGKNLVTIGAYAFSYNRYLKTIDLSVCTGLKTIDDYAFYHNAKVTSLTFPNSLEIIGKYAFGDCWLLTELEIGTNIKRIGEYAFYTDSYHDDCYHSELKTVYINGGNHAVIEDYAFYRSVYLDKLYIGDGVEIIGRGAFDECNDLSIINIGNTVTTIKANALTLGRGEGKIIIGTGVTTMEKDAIHCDDYDYIYGCGNMKTVEADIKIYSKNLTNCTATSLPNYPYSDNPRQIRVYCYENSETHKTLADKECGDVIKFLQSDGKLTNLKVNGLYDFNKEKKEYVLYIEQINYIEPIFDQPDVYYTISKFHRVCTLKVYDPDMNIIDTYKIIQRDSTCYAHLFPIDIKVNNVSVRNFQPKTDSYVGYIEDLKNVRIEPVFNQENVKYKVVKTSSDVYAIRIFDDYDPSRQILTYKIYVREILPKVVEDRYAVIGDVSLLLNSDNTSTVRGTIALTAGTYMLKIAKNTTVFGYGATVTDKCNGLSLKEQYKSYITLKATGGTYTFQFDKNTQQLVIKHDSTMPREYLLGDIDTILKPVKNKPLSIGTQQLPKGTYKFKLYIGGKKFGYNKVVADATPGSLSLNSKYTSYIILNATGGLYTFKLNTETNKLIITCIPNKTECETDVHISGDINLVLTQTEKFPNKFTKTIYLPHGSYTFKVYSYGVVHTTNQTIDDSGSCTLQCKYTTPITLNARGGYYEFVFNTISGAFDIKR